MSGSTLYSLQMDQQATVASSTAIVWEDVQDPAFTTAGYAPVMALAQNHIHFLGIPGLTAGQARIFVIHCKSASAVYHANILT